MKISLLVNGRLAWPVVAACVFLALSLVTFDLLWRVLTVSFEALAMSAAIVILLGLGLIFGLGRRPHTSR